MAMNPNNPFETRPSGPQTFDDPPSGHGRSSIWLWVLGIIGVLVVLGLLLCCGGGYFAFQWGQGMMGEAIKQQVAGSPAIEEHIGEIESMHMDFKATGEAAQEDANAIAFRVEGSKGSGVIVIQQDRSRPADEFALESAELLLPDGSRYPIVSSEDTIDEQPLGETSQPHEPQEIESLQ